jgi:hypothetical protein
LKRLAILMWSKSKMLDGRQRPLLIEKRIEQYGRRQCGGR